MSAFVCSTAHIDALVQVALNGTTDGEGRWEALRMNFYIQPRDTEQTDWDVLGQVLHNTNVDSVNYRYDETDAYEEYSFPCRVPLVSLAQALKAVRCYEYQACEHPGWEASDAKRFCDVLTAALICSLPGYAEAAWEIQEAN